MDLEMRKNLLRCYYANGNSATAAIRQYKRENNLIKDPCAATSVKRMVEKFERTYSLKDETHGRSSLENERTEFVTEAIQEAEGKISIRQVSHEVNIPPTSVYRIMKDSLNLKPFKFKMMQELKPQDYESRMEFGRWFYHNLAMIPNIMWSDEAHFHLDGEISRYHCRIWSENNPRQFLTKPLHPQKVSVWFGFTSKFCVKPYFFDTTINGENYLQMLQTHVRPGLARMRKLSTTVFMQDGAPAHFSIAVRGYLEEIFGADRIISRGCAIPWPPRSPDLSPLDYWFWGTLKARIFHYNPPSNIQQLKERIVEECGRFSPDEFSNAVGDLGHRIELMMGVHGQQFEHLK